MNLKKQIDLLKSNTKMIVVGGAIIVTASWGSCQLKLGDEAVEVEAPAEAEAPAEEVAPAVEDAKPDDAVEEG